MIYPGLPDHPGHAVAARQMKRFGGMVSFRVAGGEEQALDGVRARRVFTLGESLGGVECLIEHPGRMTHASVAGTDLEVPADLVRLSVGIETADDLLADLDQALGGGVSPPRPDVGLCVDFGSTFTKAPLVDLGDRRIVAAADHTTTTVGDRRARRVRRLPRRPDRRRTPAPPTPRCWPAPAPAAACGSPSSATRSWSPPRPAAGSRCRAAARSSRCTRWRRRARARPGGASGTRAGRGAADRRHRRRQRRARSSPAAQALVDAGWTGPVVVAGSVDARDEVAAHPRRRCPHVAGRQRRATDRGARAGAAPGPRSARCSSPT